jgi:hypothetical protein
VEVSDLGESVTAEKGHHEILRNTGWYKEQRVQIYTHMLTTYLLPGIFQCFCLTSMYVSEKICYFDCWSGMITYVESAKKKLSNTAICNEVSN